MFTNLRPFAISPCFFAFFKSCEQRCFFCVRLPLTSELSRRSTSEFDSQQRARLTSGAVEGFSSHMFGSAQHALMLARLAAAAGGQQNPGGGVNTAAGVAGFPASVYSHPALGGQLPASAQSPSHASPSNIAHALSALPPLSAAASPQALLAAAQQAVTLSDGTVFDGNAAAQAILNGTASGRSSPASQAAAIQQQQSLALAHHIAAQAQQQQQNGVAVAEAIRHSAFSHPAPARPLSTPASLMPHSSPPLSPRVSTSPNPAQQSPSTNAAVAEMRNGTSSPAPNLATGGAGTDGATAGSITIDLPMNANTVTFEATRALLAASLAQHSSHIAHQSSTLAAFETMLGGKRPREDDTGHGIPPAPPHPNSESEVRYSMVWTIVAVCSVQYFLPSPLI